MKNKIGKRELRKFGFLLGILFSLFIGFIIPYLNSTNFQIWTFFVSAFLFSISILNPQKLYIFYKAWINFGDILRFLNSKIILGIIFFLVIHPTAFIIRIFGYDPLKLKKKHAISFREIRKKDNIDLTKIF